LLTQINCIKYNKLVSKIAVISDSLIAIKNNTTIDIVDLSNMKVIKNLKLYKEGPLSKALNIRPYFYSFIKH
jgi:hypothetical protein